MTSNSNFSLIIGILSALTACGDPRTGPASEVKGEVTDALLKRGQLLCGNPLPAADEALTFDLARCAGRHAYLDTAMLPGGLNDVMDADGERQLTIADAAAAKALDHAFAPKVKRRVLGLFKDAAPQQTLDRLMNAIHGRQTTTLRMAGVVARALDRGGYDLTMIVPQAAVRIAPYASIVSHGGSYILLTDEAHVINVGYARGHDVAKDIRTGRSFGVSKARAALDASDVDYLEGIETILKGREAEAYQRAIMRLLTASDPRGIAELSDESQVVAVDFAAVYTAELDRHLMVGLDPKRHAWQRDLVEATWLSAYVVRSGMMFRDGKFVKGRPRDFFQQGTSGGGIGKTLRDRRHLSSAISSYMWSRPDNGAITRLAAAIGAKQGDDVIHELGLLLISKDMTGHVIAHAEAITEATVTFLKEMEAEAASITAFIHSSRQQP